MKHLSIISLTIASFLTTAIASADESTALDPKTQAVSSAPQSRLMPGWRSRRYRQHLASPEDRQNFGRLRRSFRTNRSSLSLSSRPNGALDQPDHVSIGFKPSCFLYGSDARYLHSTGLLDLTTDDTVQPDIPEIWFLAHFPSTGTATGLDLKVGKFGTYIGAEMSDPHLNPFYSHSYIYNFGAPFNATGVLATLHTTTWLDTYAGVTRGVN
jgi:hypothetical protein